MLTDSSATCPCSLSRMRAVRARVGRLLAREQIEQVAQRLMARQRVGGILPRGADDEPGAVAVLLGRLSLDRPRVDQQRRRARAVEPQPLSRRAARQRDAHVRLRARVQPDQFRDALLDLLVRAGHGQPQERRRRPQPLQVRRQAEDFSPVRAHALEKPVAQQQPAVARRDARSRFLDDLAVQEDAGHGFLVRKCQRRDSTRKRGPMQPSPQSCHFAVLSMPL